MKDCELIESTTSYELLGMLFMPKDVNNSVVKMQFSC